MSEDRRETPNTPISRYYRPTAGRREREREEKGREKGRERGREKERWDSVTNEDEREKT